MTGCPARIGSLRPDGVAYWESAPEAATTLLRAVASGAAQQTAVGQVMLAFSADIADDDMISRGRRNRGSDGGITCGAIEQALSLIRLSGIAITRNPQPNRRLSVAVPVTDAGGGVDAALELDVEGFDQVESVLGDLQAASRRLSEQGITTRGLALPGEVTKSIMDHDDH